MRFRIFILLLVLALAPTLFLVVGWVDRDRGVSGAVLLEEILLDPARFDGQRVTIICYLWSHNGSHVLFNLPTSDLIGEESSESGWDFLLAQADPSWDQSISSSGEDHRQKLALVEGIFHKAPAEDPGSGVTPRPHIRILDGKMIESVVPEESTGGGSWLDSVGYWLSGFWNP